MATRLSPAALLARGALFTYLQPRLAMDAKPLAMKMIVRATDGVTSKNFGQRQRAIVNSLRRTTQGRLAQDDGISDLASLLSALKPAAEQADQAPGLGQIASAPGGSAGPGMVSPSPDAEPHDTVANIKAYLEQEGVAPEIINNLDAFLAQHQPNGPGGPAPNGPNGQGGDVGARVGIGGMDAVVPATHGEAQDQGDDDLTTGEPGSSALRVMEPRGGMEDHLDDMRAHDQDPDLDDDDEDDDDLGGMDQKVPEEQDEQMGGVAKVSSEGVSSRVVNGRGGANDQRLVTRKALDKAIKVAQDAAIRNQRAIYQAAQFCSQWIGQNQLAMDSNSPADVYRATLKALRVRDADKMHPDALRPVLEAQPRPAARQAREHQVRLAQDSAGGKTEGSFAERFPEASKITLQ